MPNPNLQTGYDIATPSEQEGRTGLKGYVYDAKTGTWQESIKPQTGDNAAVLEQKTQENLAKLGLDTGSETQSSSISAKGSSAGDANKDFVETEYYTLEGDLSVIPTKKTIKISAGDTVAVYGIRKYLSGQYFINTVTRTIDNSNGYSHSFSAQKNGFSDTLKGNSPLAQAAAKKTSVDETRPQKTLKPTQGIASIPEPDKKTSWITTRDTKYTNWTTDLNNKVYQAFRVCNGPTPEILRLKSEGESYLTQIKTAKSLDEVYSAETHLNSVMNVLDRIIQSRQNDYYGYPPNVGTPKTYDTPPKE